MNIMNEDLKELVGYALAGCGCILLALGVAGAVAYIVAAAARLGMGS